MSKPSYQLGVSGHLDLVQTDVPELEIFLETKLKWLFDQLKDYLQPMLVTGLARGADQIVAECALKVGWQLKAVLPFPRNVFISTSDFLNHPKAKHRLLHLLDSCDGRIVEMDWPPQQMDLDIPNLLDQAYRNQSRYIVNKCDAIMALWDGMEVMPGGCGTAYVVDLCKRSSQGQNQSPTPLEIVSVRREKNSGQSLNRYIQWSDQIQISLNQINK